MYESRFNNGGGTTAVSSSRSCRTIIPVSNPSTILDWTKRAAAAAVVEVTRRRTMLALILASLFLAALVKFALADGDFTLLSKGPPKRAAIQGKVVWITGASQGIGEVLAKQFASLGAKLVLSARNVAALERVKSDILGKYPATGVEILPLDLGSGEDSIREAVEKTESYFSGAGVDYMVHNAAYDPAPKTALAMTEEDLLTTFKTNVLGTITITRLLAPYMLKRGNGHFIVINSAAGKVPSPGQAVYSASKFALNGYFHTLRSELYQKGIKVTVVCPGPVASKPKSAGHKNDAENPMPTERCVQLIISAATHGLKEVWISKQPVLLVMYLVQYMPTIGYWFMDKIGVNRVEASEGGDSPSVLTLLFGQKKKSA